MAWGRDGQAAVLPAAAPPPAAGPGLTRLEVLRRLDAGPRGLTDAEADARLARYGENHLPESRTTRGLLRVARSLRDPFTMMLLVLGAVSAVVASWGTACVITVLVAVSCALRTTGEIRAERASAALRELVAGTATVRRRGRPDGPAATREVPVEQLVPGDVVCLGPGDLVPADVRLLGAAGLTVHQGMLTGESAPVAKHPVEVPVAVIPRQGGGQPSTPELSGFHHPHLCFQGSSVASGSATAVVVATGAATQFARGQAAGPRRRRPRAAPTAFDRSVDGISWILIRFMLLTPPLVLMANAAVRGRGLETLPFAVAVAVGMTPEMLPVIVTTALSRGSARLARESDVIVRRLPALHDAGAMDVLCVDKTGTLTQDRPIVDGAADPYGRPDPAVLRWAALNSWWTVHLAELPEPDPLDDALLGTDSAADDTGFDGVDALPFDPERRIATAVVSRPGAWARHILVTKGAVAEVLERCTHMRVPEAEECGESLPFPDTAPLDDATRADLLGRAAAHAEEGLRVVAVAVAERRARGDAYTPEDERDLAFVGFVTFHDAVADTAADALTALSERGITVKVLTGDHPGTAVRICRALGLGPDPGAAVTGRDIDALDDDALAGLARTTTVFARCTPAHKARVVTALRRAGHTTGFLGDGVNDLPALRAADVGMCPRGAVDVARETCDVVLASKDLTAIDRTVAEGRRSSGNVASYLRVTISSNLGNVIAMLVAGAILPFLPMLPAQVLVQNLLFDIAQLALAFDNPPDAALRRPLMLRPDRFLRFVTAYGSLNAAADIATFGVLWWATDGDDPFHAGWFTENLLTQALVITLLRTGRRAAEGRTPGPIRLATVGLAAIGLAVPITPLAPLLGMGTLPLRYYAALGVVLTAYAVALALTRKRRQ